MTESESNPIGRPPMYASVELMQEVIDAYFEECKSSWLDEVAKPQHPTITGLALALGFNSRQSLLNYEDKPQFVDTVKKAKTRVEAYIEQNLYGGQVTGLIFNLKNNFNWRDQTDLNLTGKLDTISDEQIDNRINDLIGKAGVAVTVGRKSETEIPESNS